MLVAFMDAHFEAGVVGPRLLRPDGTAQPYTFGGDPTLGYLLRRGFNRLRGRYSTIGTLTQSRRSIGSPARA